MNLTLLLLTVALVTLVQRHIRARRRFAAHFKRTPCLFDHPAQWQAFVARLGPAPEPDWQTAVRQRVAGDADLKGLTHNLRPVAR